ncbi:hypothetical protein RN001_002101 [Aquatica leii]|uniref:Phorbol-ester/DAG-type domain-containing protein n=1 Tax=Aquatica leii TaxID=1421715 RepID=A0AAN7QAW3_9COLE|nr:hypothetical protein RN001_002101 [Aquatica leii]
MYSDVQTTDIEDDVVLKKRNVPKPSRFLEDFDNGSQSFEGEYDNRNTIRRPPPFMVESRLPQASCNEEPSSAPALYTTTPSRLLENTFIVGFPFLNKTDFHDYPIKMAESENALNLLPDKPCKHCKSMPKLGLKCKNCGSVFHPGCVKYIKNVKLINDNQVICCANSETEPVAASELCTNINTTNIVNNGDVSSIEINYLKSLLAHKDLIINNQQDTIESLKAQVGLLNTLLSSTC